MTIAGKAGLFANGTFDEGGIHGGECLEGVVGKGKPSGKRDSEDYFVAVHHLVVTGV